MTIFQVEPTFTGKNNLKLSMGWYKSWHNHPRHRHAHLLIFFSVLFVVAAFLFAGLLNLRLETGGIATAQTPCDPSVIFPNIVAVCDISPKLVRPGDTVMISGYFMGNVIQLSSADDGTSEPIEGQVNGTYDLLTFIIPPGTPDGIYGIDVTGADGASVATSTTRLTIAKNPNVLPPPEPPTQPPVNQPPTPLIPNPPATEFNDLISNSFNYAILLVGIAVFIMIMWGGFLWLTSAANPGNIVTAKKYIFNAILGAILLLSAYVILYTINPQLVGGEFNLKGIPVGSSNSNAVSTQSLVAFNEVQAASAVIAGCVITTEIQDFTAIDCPSDSSLASGLVQDPIIQTTDSNTNNQVAATTLQNGGNNGNGRKIVVLDTGYNYNHPELSSSYIIGKDFINNDADPMDDHVTGNGAPAHGSHVAGIITADGLDSKARGVAPGVGIIAGKILDKNGEGKWSYMTDAIYWAVNGPDGTFGTGDDFKADVINISVGGGSFTGMCDTVDETTRLFAKAIQYAKDNGVLVVISSGNFSNGVSMPGCIDASFTVGAVDSSDRIANFSGRGSPVDIVAPGVNIYSSLLGNNYGTKKGTSQAAPVVSGIAALLKSANPGYTVTQLEQTLTSTACDLGSTGKDNTFGWGRVTAVSGSCTPAPVPPQNQVTGTLTTSPTSCTRGSISINPNCDITLSYKLNGITSPTQLTVRKNNTLFQNIQCNGGTCTGQLNDPDPNAGTYQYIISLPNNSAVAKVNAYIYTAGTITASFSSCAKSASPANPNCDVSLNINAPGITPNSIIVTRDGINWRVVRCTNPSCNTQLVDADPILGIHTYTLLNASNNSKLARATVTITTTTSSGGSSGPQQTITLCSDINYGGTCEIFASNDVNLSDNLVGNDTASSIILNTSDMRLCTDINYGGLCEDFTASDPDLSNNLIGNDRASSIGSM